MPYKIVHADGGYYVETVHKHTDSDGQFHHIHKLREHHMHGHNLLPHHRHSKHPLTHEMAMRQLRALYVHGKD